MASRRRRAEGVRLTSADQVKMGIIRGAEVSIASGAASIVLSIGALCWFERRLFLSLARKGKRARDLDVRTGPAPDACVNADEVKVAASVANKQRSSPYFPGTPVYSARII